MLSLIHSSNTHPPSLPSPRPYSLELLAIFTIHVAEPSNPSLNSPLLFFEAHLPSCGPLRSQQLLLSVKTLLKYSPICSAIDFTKDWGSESGPDWIFNQVSKGNDENHLRTSALVTNLFSFFFSFYLNFALFCFVFFFFF